MTGDATSEARTDQTLSRGRRAIGVVLLLVIIVSLAVAMIGVMIYSTADGRYMTAHETEGGCVVEVHYENGTTEEIDSSTHEEACEELLSMAPESEAEAKARNDKDRAYGSGMVIGGVVVAGLSYGGIRRL